ncbi:PepSY domain-containing protein [Pseudochelatococcus contaminans]|uniref:PepSY domain-containing protein n=1 Tax=Pseudochelatococcus contaminans TaxID=1538103 RepID=A0A7W5Z3Z8_9HYPH|nr:PepSY domain-containing protein [Pseudochelatococcus contaminans]MBB3809723.1 hypothetical protein [Pseudochelatococcus contaminans]
MKKIFLTVAAISLGSVAAFAQQPTPAPSPSTETGTAPLLAPATPDRKALVAGENSFTETQARDRIADAGYADVSALALDSNGIWRGTATKGGQVVNVGLDYQGNVVEQ